MSGIYGDTLLHFAEQFQEVEYYNMNPLINAGFEKVGTPETINVIFHNTKPKAVKDSNGNLVFVKGLEVWSIDALNPGWFIKEGEDVYRIGEENKWSFEASFYAYGLSKVVGDDGEIVNDPVYNEGSEDFG
jgi:hypothetical protein